MIHHPEWQVSADGDGVVSHAGAGLWRGGACILGLVIRSWPRADCTSNRSSSRVVSAARTRPLRIAASIPSGEVPIISITR
jgi:hypothetical protein